MPSKARCGFISVSRPDFVLGEELAGVDFARVDFALGALREALARAMRFCARFRSASFLTSMTVGEHRTFAGARTHFAAPAYAR